MTTPPPAVANPAQLFDLTGRTALITGGSRGLGKEMALAFAHQGADIMIASRSIESCEETAAEVRRETGRNCVPYACHIGRWDELEGLAEAAWNEFGGVDILVNNAGKSPLYDNITNVNEQMWDSVIGLNLKGPFRLSALLGSRNWSRWFNHQHFKHRGNSPHTRCHSVHSSKSRIERDDNRFRANLWSARSRQLHHARLISHRHQQSLELGHG